MQRRRHTFIGLRAAFLKPFAEPNNPQGLFYIRIFSSLKQNVNKFIEKRSFVQYTEIALLFWEDLSTEQLR